MESLEIYCLRKIILVELINHLLKILGPIEFPRGTGLRKHIKAQFQQIMTVGLLYCQHSLQ